MAQRRIERLPVVDEEDRLVGIVTRRDLLQVFLRPDEEIRRAVVDEVIVNALWLDPETVTVDVSEGVVTLGGQLERRSDVPIALRMVSQVDGVVAVVDKLTYRMDDSHLRPDEPAVYGVGEAWLRRL
jgi:CBS domain-containing protein